MEFTVIEYILKEGNKIMGQIDDKTVFKMAGTTLKEIDSIRKYIYLLGEYQKMNDSSVVISRETLKEQIENRTLEVVLAEYEEEIVGIALFYKLASGFSGKTSMFLNIFYVDEGKRFFGVGKKLIRYLSQIAIDRDYERIEWLCLDWNKPALVFYRGIGSKEIDTVTTFRLMPDDMVELLKV